jgi:hypothetical protein
MRGNWPPFTIRLSSASLEGRVFVGSRPIRRVLAKPRFGVGEQRVERRRVHGVGRVRPPEYAGPHDWAEVWGENESS